MFQETQRRGNELSLEMARKSRPQPRGARRKGRRQKGQGTGSGREQRAAGLVNGRQCNLQMPPPRAPSPPQDPGLLASVILTLFPYWAPSLLIPHHSLVLIFPLTSWLCTHLPLLGSLMLWQPQLQELRPRSHVYGTNKARF